PRARPPAATRPACPRCSPPPTASWRSPTTCAPPWRAPPPRSRRPASTIPCTTPPPATGPSAPGRWSRPPRSAPAKPASPWAWWRRWRSWRPGRRRCSSSPTTARRWARSTMCWTARACLAWPWCWRGRRPATACTCRCNRARPRPRRRRPRWPPATPWPRRWCCWRRSPPTPRRRGWPPATAAACAWGGAMADPRRTAVVIPALNEVLRIRDVVTQTLAHCPWVIVVDDGSTDGTAERLRDLPVTVLRHGLRRGKGAALRTGFAEALARGATGVLTIDGDAQHDPSDLPRLLAAAARHPNHIIIGARLRHRAAAPRLRRMANAFGDWGVSWGAGYRIADSQS